MNDFINRRAREGNPVYCPENNYNTHIWITESDTAKLHCEMCNIFYSDFEIKVQEFVKASNMKHHVND